MVIGIWGMKQNLHFTVDSLKNPLLFSAAEENPYSPTYQFPASTPSPISEGNNKGPYIFFCTNAALSVYFLPGVFSSC